MIASHYAEPVERVVAATADLRAGPAADSEVIRTLAAGEPFALLDDSLGWAWGYAGTEHRVGYVLSDVLRSAQD